MDKGRPGNKMTAAAVTAAVLLLVHLAIRLMGDALIVQLGIRAYRGTLTVSGGLALGGAAAFLAAAVLHIRRVQAGKRVTEAEESRQAALAARAEELRRQKESPLSVSGRMDPAELQNRMRQAAEIAPSGIAPGIRKIADEMAQMDRLQEKLNRLLKNNGADALGNTEDILDQVEQYLCRNVRKVLNYLDVLDWTEDRAILSEKLENCRRDNAVQLEKAQELIVALTEFLNSQGDSGDTAETLEMYKQTILKSIRPEHG